MTFDRKEHLELIARQKAEKAGQDTVRLARMLDQAAVSAKSLTGDQRWDVFLQYIQATIDAAEKEREGFEATLHNPNVVSYEQIMAAKLGWTEVTAMIRTCKAVQELPKDIIAHGEQARSLLERLETVDARKQSAA